MSESVPSGEAVGFTMKPLCDNLLDPSDEGTLKAIAQRLMQPRAVAQQRQRIDLERRIQDLEQRLHALHERIDQLGLRALLEQGVGVNPDVAPQSRLSD